MLILERECGQTIRIGPDIFVTVTAIRGKRIKIGITAPKNVQIVRDDAIQQEKSQCRSQS